MTVFKAGTFIHSAGPQQGNEEVTYPALTVLCWNKICKRPSDLILDIGETGSKVPREGSTHNRYMIGVEMYFGAYSVVPL
jgi:hypothetical protein